MNDEIEKIILITKTAVSVRMKTPVMIDGKPCRYARRIQKGQTVEWEVSDGVVTDKRHVREKVGSDLSVKLENAIRERYRDKPKQTRQ